MGREKKYRLSFLSKEKAEHSGFTPTAGKALAVFFLLLLLLFPHYTPYDNPPTHDSSILQIIFNLYFFVAFQALGIVHEAGHGICYVLPCPEFFMVLNGTLFQVGFPALVAYYYKRRGNALGMWIGLFFVGFSLHYTAYYISTAHEGAILPAAKSFLGVDAYHDFHYLLSRVGLLQYNGLMASLTKITSHLIMICAVFRMGVTAFATQGRGTHESQ